MQTKQTKPNAIHVAYDGGGDMVYYAVIGYGTNTGVGGDKVYYAGTKV